MHLEYQKACQKLAESTAVVIPAYFSRSDDGQLWAELLTETALGCKRELQCASRVCISVDGENPALETGLRLREQHGLSLVSSKANRGKLSALKRGLEEMLLDPGVRYFVFVDQDGDHFPNELANLLRGCLHVEETLGKDRVLVLGRRSTRHHPLGYFRGEMEELVDRILMDCLQYHAARKGTPLDLRFALHLDDFPDFHTGFKLLTRPVAASILSAGFPSLGLSDEAVFRHAVEAVLGVEAILAGATLVSVARSTRNEQPLSVFGMLDRRQLMADKVLWPGRRLEVPPVFLAQWFDNHAARLLLGTLNPEGKQELRELRRILRRELGQPDDPRGIAGLSFL
jgi:hypothetical protein